MVFRLTDQRVSLSLSLSLSVCVCVSYMRIYIELEQVEIFEIPQRFSE